MTAPGEAQFVLLEFYGAGHRYSLTALAERLPRTQVQVWDVLTERVLSAGSLAAFAAVLVAANPVGTGPVVVIGSCFGVPLAAHCVTALHRAGRVVALGIDPVAVDDEVLRAQIAALGAQVGTDVADLDLTAAGWVDHVVGELRHGVVKRAVDDGDSPDDAEEVANHLLRHYRHWLHYIQLCRQDQGSTRVTRAVLSEAGRACADEVDDELRLGTFADTPDVLASGEVAGWVLRAGAATRDAQ
jgi:hypothetical protein